jgi:hypothetical protein
MSASDQTLKPVVGKAADGSVIKIGDKVSLVGEVLDISDAFMEITIATVRVPKRLGGPAIMCFNDHDIPTVIDDTT